MQCLPDHIHVHLIIHSQYYSYLDVHDHVVDIGCFQASYMFMLYAKLASYTIHVPPT